MADHSSHVHHCDQPHPSHVRSSQPPPSPEQFPNVLGAREPRTRYEPPSYNPIPATRHMGTSHSSTGNNRSYHGIRCRSGKWVSEIREPRKSNRIWLGTYPTAEMAAVAHDVATLALRGTDAILNFPETVRSYPVPASTSPSDIRAAAAAAASVLMKPRIDDAVVPENDGVASFASSGKVEEFIDEEEIFDMPTLLVSMAEGMLMSPPWLSPPSSDDSPEVSESSGSLWSYP